MSSLNNLEGSLYYQFDRIVAKNLQIEPHWHYFALFCTAGYDRSETFPSWLDLFNPCQSCGAPVLTGSGVACAIFGKPRKTGMVCLGMWHAKCYRQDPKDPFPVLHASDLDNTVLGSEQLEVDDPARFHRASYLFSSHLPSLCPDILLREPIPLYTFCQPRVFV